MATTYSLPEDRVPLPPPNAKVSTTCCDYCTVACGYKVYTWPLGQEGGPKASQNAFGVNYPVDALSGYWVSPNMHNIVKVDGRLSHVIVIPDGDSKVVNIGGTHSIRGGTIAQKCYNPAKPTYLPSGVINDRNTSSNCAWGRLTDSICRPSASKRWKAFRNTGISCSGC